MELLLAVLAGVLYATGLYLMLRRRLAQLIVGLGLLSNGSNIIILAAAGATRARPPLILDPPLRPDQFADPFHPSEPAYIRMLLSMLANDKFRALFPDLDVRDLEKRLRHATVLDAYGNEF